MSIFEEIHQDLPREGPGDDASTRRALAMLSGLPTAPRILDVGCGPGAQTRVLLGVEGAHVVAVDVRSRFLVQAKQLAPRSRHLSTAQGSMRRLPFADQSFDAIWSEGAIYIMGFENGLRAWRPLLKPMGYIAVSEASWLQPSPPAEAVDFWRANYPGMRQVSENLEIVRAAGYGVTGHFVIPADSWWKDYYIPMEQRIARLRRQYQGNAEALDELAAEAAEIALFRRHSDSYGYVFYVMQAE